MRLVLGKLAIEMPVRREGWAWEGVLNLGTLEAAGAVEWLESGIIFALLWLVHGMAFSGDKSMVYELKRSGKYIFSMVLRAIACFVLFTLFKLAYLRKNASRPLLHPFVGVPASSMLDC